MSLKGISIGDTENCTTYIQRQLGKHYDGNVRRWKQELERDPVDDPLMTALFRTTIVDTMPPRVKDKLEVVVILNSMTRMNRS